MFVFEERGKLEYLEKNFSNQQQTQPIHDARSGNRTWATLVGSECCHHCAIPAPPVTLKWVRVNERGVRGEFCTSYDLYTLLGAVFFSHFSPKMGIDLNYFNLKV